MSALCSVSLPWVSSGALGWSHVSVLGPHCSGSSLGARPLSRGRLWANQTRVMPRREMRVAGNQGQGPGHNGAIVGLLSVDFQAAVPHPPSLLLHIPAPLPGSYPKLLPPFRPPPEGNRIPDPTPDRRRRASPCMAYYVHQVATKHYTSEGEEGGKGRPLNH